MPFITQKPYVALMLRTSAKTYREILHGVLRYTNRTNPWALMINQNGENAADQARLGLNRLKYSGIIIDETDPLFGELDRFGKTPVVTIENTRPPARPKANRIYLYCDNDSIGQTGARYLMDRGFRSFAYVHDVLSLRWSQERCAAYVGALRNAGYGCSVYPEAVSGRLDVAPHDREALPDWLKSLPKPIGLFAANDMRARDVLDACTRAGIAVPSEIAVLGCDDDEIVCETAVPPLSSVRFTTEQAGFAAARELHELIRGNRPSASGRQKIPYGPSGVITRLSTETVVIADKLVEQALDYIRMNALSGMNVGELARRLNASRRTLELRFKRATGRQIYEEVLRLRLEKACEHLREGSMTIADIAESCGFPSASHFGVMFRRRLGTTPSAYRTAATRRCTDFKYTRP